MTPSWLRAKGAEERNRHHQYARVKEKSIRAQKDRRICRRPPRWARRISRPGSSRPTSPSSAKTHQAQLSVLAYFLRLQPAECWLHALCGRYCSDLTDEGRNCYRARRHHHRPHDSPKRSLEARTCANRNDPCHGSRSPDPPGPPARRPGRAVAQCAGATDPHSRLAASLTKRGHTPASRARVRRDRRCVQPEMNLSDDAGTGLTALRGLPSRRPAARRGCWACCSFLRGTRTRTAASRITATGLTRSTRLSTPRDR